MDTGIVSRGPLGNALEGLRQVAEFIGPGAPGHCDKVDEIRQGLEITQGAAIAAEKLLGELWPHLVWEYRDRALPTWNTLRATLGLPMCDIAGNELPS